jgi:thymidine kinase
MLQVITGGMFAGKTDELLRRLERHFIAKRRVALVRPDVDTRDGVTHNGKEYKAVVLGKDDVVTFGKIIANYDVIGIDEAQFFSASIYFAIKSIIQSGIDKIIIASGLDMDYTGEPFGIMPLLMAIADEIAKLHAVCEDCYKAANVSYRMTDQREQVIIGAKGEYKALCWACVKQKK